MGFEEGSGEYIPPQRVPLTDDNFPNWFDHVPVSYKYPWNDLKVPLTKNAEVSVHSHSFVCMCVQILRCLHTLNNLFLLAQLVIEQLKCPVYYGLAGPVEPYC